MGITMPSMAFAGFGHELLAFPQRTQGEQQPRVVRGPPRGLRSAPARAGEPRAAGVFLSTDGRKPDTWRRHARVFGRRVGALPQGIRRSSDGQPTPQAVFTDDIPDLCVIQFKSVAPLQQWLVDLLAD